MCVVASCSFLFFLHFTAVEFYALRFLVALLWCAALVLLASALLVPAGAWTCSNLYECDQTAGKYFNFEHKLTALAFAGEM